MIMNLWHWLGGYNKSAGFTATATPRMKKEAAAVAAATAAVADRGVRRKAREGPGASPGLRTRNAQKMMGPMAGTMTPIKAVTRKDLDHDRHPAIENLLRSDCRRSSSLPVIFI